MSARDALRAAVNGTPPDPTADDLSDALGLTEHGLKVTGANVFGRGPNASVDVSLSDGSKLTFERFSDITKPAMLATYLVTCTGVVSTFKGAQAGMIAAAIYKLAKHHADEGDDDAAREFGYEYLRLAPVLVVDMSDQADRWRAFSALATMNPATDTQEDRSAARYAMCTTVLQDKGTQRRLIRSGWFQSYVKREVGGLYSPARLAIQMERVGWTRSNSEGRVKATNVADNRTLAWRFYVVSPNWEHGQVPASVSPSARGSESPSRARKGSPAGTWEPGEPERDADPLADAKSAPTCRCDRPLPAPDSDGELRCTHCGHACAGWEGPA